MPREQPVENRSARAADVQITGGRGGETNADFRAHPGRGYTHFDRCCSGGCVSRRGAWHKRLYTLLHKNSSGTASRVSIFGKIHFCDSSVTICEQTNALDRIESNVRDILRPQPFQERAALKRDWQRAKLYDGEFCMGRIR